MVTLSLELSIAIASFGAAVCISAIGALIFLRNERIKFDERMARRAILYARVLDRADAGPIEQGIAAKELRLLGYIPASELESYLKAHKKAWVEAPVLTSALELSVGIGPLRVNFDVKNVLSNLAAIGGAATAAAAVAAAVAALTT